MSMSFHDSSLNRRPPVYGYVCREVGHFDLGEGGMLSPFKSHLGSAEEVIASDLRRESRGRKKRLFMAERERERERERAVSGDRNGRSSSS